MRIQRYIAKDMRSALGQVRDAMGPEAVILSSGTVGDQVEVVAAIDVEIAREHAAPRGAPQQVTQAEPVSSFGERAPVRRASSQLSEALVPKAAQAAAHATAEPSQAPQERAQHSELANEVKDMRRMLESQLATLAWNDMSRRSPLQAAMLKELAQLGITQDLASSLARKIPADLSFSAARRFALATIARTVQVTGDRWLETGGRIAFAGPAGAGKTTLLAKLAARWVLRHGPRRVALVSADAVRIGAHEQMHMLGRLLGVTAHTVYDVAELPELLDALSGQQLVLIDTAGASPRDPDLARRLHLLSQAEKRIETSLVIPASIQSGAIEEAMKLFAVAQPSSCVITKVDEAVSLGGVLSTLVRHKLPVAYISDGQRVPEDLHPARSHTLVSRAVEIASRSGATADDEVMQRRISGVTHGRR
jgi:flagellar biosynthesis protein FlhF